MKKVILITKDKREVGIIDKSYARSDYVNVNAFNTLESINGHILSIVGIKAFKKLQLFIVGLGPVLAIQHLGYQVQYN